MMATARFKQLRNQNSFNLYKSDTQSVIQELQEKMSRLKFRILDYQNKNQMLHKELLQVRKVLNTEIAPKFSENYEDWLNKTDFRGRREKILVLKDKVNELQNRIKVLEQSKGGKRSASVPRMPKTVELEGQRKYQNKQTIDKELQYLLQHSCQMKRKIEVWKKRNAELSKELEALRLELDGLLEKSKEDRTIHESYNLVDKELKARQAEKLNMRSKLDSQKTKNEKLVQELTTLREDLSAIISKINDDKELIDALNNQQGYLQDLLEHQNMLYEKDNRKFQDDLREIMEKHFTHSHVLDHLEAIVEQKNEKCSELQKCLEQQGILEDTDGQESVITNSEITEQSEQSQPSAAENESTAGEPEEDSFQAEIDKLNEEYELCRNTFQSWREQIEQMQSIVSSNEEKANEWVGQLLNTKSLLSQKNAELRDLRQTMKKLQRSVSSKKGVLSPSPGSHFNEEMLKKNDVLKAEHQFLRSLWKMLMSNKENSLEVFNMYAEGRRKIFISGIRKFLASLDQDLTEDEQPLDFEDEQTNEQSSVAT